MIWPLSYTEQQAILYLHGVRAPYVNVTFVLNSEFGKNGWGKRLDAKGLTTKEFGTSGARLLNSEGLRIANLLKEELEDS